MFSKADSEGPFALDDNDVFLCNLVNFMRTVILVTMQSNSNDIKSLCRCRQVRTVSLACGKEVS